MFTVKFKWAEDAEYGLEGWIPEKFPHFNATNGFGIAHDVLEHFADDEGDLAGEMRAFGSMINVRWMGGWQYMNGRFGARRPEENMASDISRFLDQISYDNNYITKPPRTYKLNEEYAEQMINDALHIGVKEYKQEAVSNDNELMANYKIEQIVENMRGWMRIGYRQSVRRYHNACQCELAHFFSDLEKEVGRYDKGEFGEVMTVKVSPKNLEFKVNVAYPYDDYYD